MKRKRAKRQPMYVCQNQPLIFLIVLSLVLAAQDKKCCSRVLKSDKCACPLKKFTLLIALFHEKPTVLRWHWGQDGPKNVPLQTEGIVRGQQFWENGGETLLAQMLINAKMQSKCKIPDESKWESPRQVPLGLAPDRKGVQAFRFQGTHRKGVNYEMNDHGQ